MVFDADVTSFAVLIFT